MEPAHPLTMVFEHIKHLLYCLSLLGIAGAEWKLHEHMGMPRWLAAALAGLLAGLSLLLFIWNAVDGFRSLAIERRWLLVALLGGIYLSIVVLMAHAFPTLAFGK
jgi:hypothetical protein